MDNGGPPDNGRFRVDPYKGVQTPWNMIPQYQLKEMNAFVMHLYAEKHAALEELDRVINEKNTAIEERNKAIKQRDEAVAARDIAIRERDNVIAALQFQENNSMNGNLEKRGLKRENLEINSSSSKPPKFGKKLSEDLNIYVSNEDESREIDLYMGTPLLKKSDVRNFPPVSREDIDLINQINLDGGGVPPPVCSCTGVPRQCYKSGNGGWQSSCCTLTLSVYPLPQLPNKRHSRMGGRKMSGNVFARLLTRLAEEGHDLSLPVDLKNYWAKHGTNRYVTVK